MVWRFSRQAAMPREYPLEEPKRGCSGLLFIPEKVPFQKPGFYEIRQRSLLLLRGSRYGLLPGSCRMTHSESAFPIALSGPMYLAFKWPFLRRFHHNPVLIRYGEDPN